MATKGKAGNEETQYALHSNILVEKTEDVFDKYEVDDVLGQGSMGAVAKVHIKEDMIGGSAYHPKQARKKACLAGFFAFAHKKKNPLRKKLCCSAVPQQQSQEKQQHKGDDDTTTDDSKSTEKHFFALKTIQLDRVSDYFLQELENEIDILRSLDHPNIVKAHEVYFYKKQIYLVLELCDGGDLYTRSPYSEYQAARIVTKLLSAVWYMHNHNIVHRDLKFENIMFEDSSPDAEIKVIDFGLSKKFMGKPGVMTERVGTIYTMAPQVLDGIYTSEADLWSVGVIAYMLLSATKPFNHKKRQGMIDSIMSGHYTYTNTPVWKTISDSAKDFIDHLLVIRPKNRMTAQQALDHPWIVNRELLATEIPNEELLLAVDDSLLKYKQTSQLKKLALTVIAHQSTADEILELRKVFDKYDTQKDGVLAFDEFKAALNDMKYSEETMREIFSSVDLNKNGHIQYTEFLAATLEAQGQIEEERIAEAFDRFDANECGYISRDDLKDLLGKEYTDGIADQVFEEGDLNQDGKISFEEFLTVFRRQSSVKVMEVLDS